jgi:hypothetical protein
MDSATQILKEAWGRNNLTTYPPVLSNHSMDVNPNKVGRLDAGAVLDSSMLGNFDAALLSISTDFSVQVLHDCLDSPIETCR